MSCELIRATTDDGLRLTGLLQRTADAGVAAAAVDAVLFLHGTGSNFYDSSLAEALTPKFLAEGIAVLRANTRGHDAVAVVPSSAGPRRIGSAFERVGEAPHDLLAWVGRLVELGMPRVGIVGHSLGALKAIYTLAHKPMPTVRCLVALSPPRLSYSQFVEGPRGPEFLQTLQQAQQHVAAGRGETLMDVEIPLRYLIAADRYVDKYGPQEQYDLLRFVAEVPCPTLLTFGSQEVATEVAFRDLPAAVEAAIAGKDHLRVVTIPEANHVYTGQIERLAYKVRAWLVGIDRGPTAAA